MSLGKFLHGSSARVNASNNYLAISSISLSVFKASIRTEGAYDRKEGEESAAWKLELQESHTECFCGRVRCGIELYCVFSEQPSCAGDRDTILYNITNKASLTSTRMELYNLSPVWLTMLALRASITASDCVGGPW